MRKSTKEPKSIQMSFRVTERFRDALQAAADRDRRSQANMLEVIVDYYVRNVIEKPGAEGKAAKKKVARKR